MSPAASHLMPTHTDSLPTVGAATRKPTLLSANDIHVTNGHIPKPPKQSEPTLLAKFIRGQHELQAYRYVTLLHLFHIGLIFFPVFPETESPLL